MKITHDDMLRVLRHPWSDEKAAYFRCQSDMLGLAAVPPGGRETGDPGYYGYLAAAPDHIRQRWIADARRHLSSLRPVRASYRRLVRAMRRA